MEPKNTKPPRLIDANELEDLFRGTIYRIAQEPKITGALEHMVRASAMVIEMINDAPTVEAVPAIQCKDCQGYDEGRCHWWYDDPEVPANGYCFQAEKKETEGNNGGR